MPVRAHHNQIGVENIRLIQNFFCHRSRWLMQCDLDAALSDFSLPLSELRSLTFILRNWLRHWIKPRNRQTRHRRQFGHPRQAIAKCTRRCGRAEFFHVNEMNLRVQACGQLARLVDHSRRCIREIDRDKDAFHVRNPV